MASKFEPDPPECFSQVMGDDLSKAYAAQAKKLGEEGRVNEAEEARTLSLLYGGFRRLVR